VWEEEVEEEEEEEEVEDGSYLKVASLVLASCAYHHFSIISRTCIAVP
jgi:hypothetical protein